MEALTKDRLMEWWRQELEDVVADMEEDEGALRVEDLKEDIEMASSEVDDLLALWVNLCHGDRAELATSSVLRVLLYQVDGLTRDEISALVGTLTGGWYTPLSKGER